VLVAATDKGICRIAFGDDAASLVSNLRADFANATQIAEDRAAIAPFLAQIDAYLRGGRERFELPLDIAATAFQQRVWDALQRIPYGETRSYTQIAETLRAPRAVRAVASACASNPVALVIPCHRVVQKGGSLAGYRWGLTRKAALLDAEAKGSARGPAQTVARASTRASDYAARSRPDDGEPANETHPSTEPGPTARNTRQSRDARKPADTPSSRPHPPEPAA
jgi:AraC family transcriptional regulator of adaptative response/methylated-DNA-[protein]-cysteine methyltransferase